MIIFQDSVFLTNLIHSVIQLPLYFIIYFIAFFIPGEIALGAINTYFSTRFERVIMALITGLVLFAYQGVLFGYANIRYATYGYLAVCFILWLRTKRRKITYSKHPCTFSFVQTLIILAIFVVGVFGQTAKFAVAGSLTSDGLHMFSGSAGDALFHTAVIEQIVRRFPPYEPGLVGVPLQNYHYWSDLVIAETIRVFHTPLLPTQYQYSYIFISILLGGAAFVLARVMQFSFSQTAILVYLQYFSSDVLYVLTYITRRVFDFSIGPLDGGVELLENQPRAYANTIALATLILLYLFLKKKSRRAGILCALLLGSAVGFKANIGIVLLIGMAPLGAYFLFTKQYTGAAISILALLCILLIYLPVNIGSGGLIWTPFWLAQDFSVHPNLGISRFELARQTYYFYKNSFGVFRMNMIMLALFVIIQSGIKSIGLIPSRRMMRYWGFPFSLFLFIPIYTGIFLATFFIQYSGGANIFNFYLASAVLLSVPTAFTLGGWIQKKWVLSLLIVICIAFLTLPRWINRSKDVLLGYIVPTNPIISTKELETMEFIKNNSLSSAVILVMNQGTWDSQFPYVSAFTQRDTFVSGQGILASHNLYQWKDREKIQHVLANSIIPNEIKTTLSHTKVDYVYFYQKPPNDIYLLQAGLKKIYDNGMVIYHVDQ